MKYIRRNYTYWQFNQDEYKHIPLNFCWTIITSSKVWKNQKICKFNTHKFFINLSILLCETLEHEFFQHIVYFKFISPTSDYHRSQFSYFVAICPHPTGLSYREVDIQCYQTGHQDIRSISLQPAPCISSLTISKYSALSIVRYSILNFGKLAS